MQGENSKKKKNHKRNRVPRRLKLSQERASYFFFIGLLIIAIFGCVASGSPRQGFLGIIFVSVGILIALFPPAFMTSKWLNVGLTFFFISLCSPLLPRSFVSIQSWRADLESLGLETGNLISPHPTATIESLIIIGSILIIGLCSLGHRINRESFLKIATLFVIAIATYAVFAILFVQNEWNWAWNPNDEFGFFANRNHMATLMVMGSLVGVGSLILYLKKKNWTGFFINLLAVGVLCWSLLGFSVSRAGLILFILFQMIWFLFVFKKNLNYKLVTSFIVLFCLACILFFLSDNTLENRVEELVAEKKTDSKLINSEKKSNHSDILGLRKYIHSDTYQMIKSEPWTGTGLGTYEFIFPFYKKEINAFNERLSNNNVLHPESNWLDLAAQAGILSTILALVCILPLLILTLLRNRKSRSWLLSLSCILSVFSILIHGIVDVPGQKIGIVMSGILLFGISIKPSHSKDKVSPRYVTFIYQLLAIGIFSLGLILVHSQWFSSGSIIFSDTQMRMNKIQKLYQLSIDSAQEKDFVNQKKYIISAINLTKKAIQRTPLDPDLHFIRGKLYSFLDGNEDKIKSSFEIESILDSTWVDLPIRQSQVWLYIDTKETRRLWTEALERANKVGHKASRDTWNEILWQARRHPIQIRDTYKLIINKDDSYYIGRWMEYAGPENLNSQMPNILQSKLLSSDTKKDISDRWKKISPNDYEIFLDSMK